MKLAFLLAWIACTAAPLVWSVWRGDPTSARLAAYCTDHVWRAPLFAALAQSALSAALALVLAWPAALAFAQWRFSGRRLGRRALWLGRLCPPALLSIPLATLAAQSPELATEVKVALAHLLFNVPAATWILFVALERVPRALVHEAKQDGIDLLGHARLVWWPAWRGASVLTFLVCFAASFAEPALTRALAGEGSLAASLPATSAGVADRALSAAFLLIPALLWSLLLGAWWARRRRRDAA